MPRKQRKTAQTAPRKSSPLLQPLESRLLLTVFTVTNTNDSGAGSLRWALDQSNANGGVDTIAFNLPAGNRVIRPGSELPGVWDAAIVDATTQPGYAGSPLVQIDGAGAGGNTTGLKVWGNSTIKGLSITGFNGSAIDLFNRGNGGNNVIQKNWIGLDLNGNAAGNNAQGVGVWGVANNLIGGPNAADRNVISASRAALGVLFQGAGATNNTLQNNYIGTDPTGTQARGNAMNGVGAQDAPANRILNNLISGNRQDGIILINRGATANVVKGNIVGLDVTGTKALANGDYGIEIQSANNLIGGPTAAERNLFSGNVTAGIVLHLGDCVGNIVENNYVGTDITGTAKIGNGYQGIAVATANANTIRGNLISGNRTEGIGVFPGNNNTITGNVIGFGATGAALTNGTWAVALYDSSTGNVVSGNFIANHPSGNVGGNPNNVTVPNSNNPPTTTVPLPGSFSLGAATYTVSESQASVTVTVKRSANTNLAASVNYATANGSATSGSDYTAAAGTLTFAAGETSKTFVVSLINDTTVEGDETLSVSLSNPTGGATLANPSTATLTIVSEDVAADTTPPRVASAEFLFDTAPQKLRYTFSENVAPSLSAFDFYLVDADTYQSFSPTDYAYDAQSNTATFSFATPLPGGRYRAHLFSSAVSDPAGNKLDGDANAAPGGDHVFNFFFLPGDVNHDAAVDFTDMVVVSQNYNTSGKSFANGDLNYDGAVDFNDLVVLSQNYNRSLTASASASPLPAAQATQPSLFADPARVAVETRPANAPIASTRAYRTTFSARRI